jgi:hypothetical protein
LTIARSRVWTISAPLNLALVGFVLFFAGLRLARPQTVFYYTEGPVLGSLAALESRGSLADLYPADGWIEPPVVLTLYPPGYFLVAAALDRQAESGGTFLGLRVVSAAALLGMLALLALHMLGRRAPPAWVLALLGAALLTPGVYRVVAGAQADTLALLLTWVGITAALGTRGARVRTGLLPLLAAATAFLCAFFTKQSFVAAPVALAVSLLLEGKIRTGVLFGSGLAAVSLLGVFLLDAATSGGYLANTLGALTGTSGWANLVSSLSESEPLQWLPIVAAVLVASRGRVNPGFAELYLLGSALLHTTAMLKTGSSVNYLLEPTFALLFLAVTRWSPGDELPANKSPRARTAGRATSGALAILCAVALGLTATSASLREYRTMRGWLASARAARVSDFEGYPLADPFFFPAILEREGRPWLNDPFAFGALEETGQWDPSRLVSDLESRQIPFALTLVDLGNGPAPPGVGTRDLVMAYFWRSRPVWTALTESYRPRTSGPVTIWLPGEDPEP